MKRKLTITTLIIVLLLSVIAVSAFAQDGNPPKDRGQGPDQNLGIAVLVEALGITQLELKDRLDAGETFADLYEEAGLDLPYFGVPQQALADALGITLEELEARLDAGETLADLHVEAGLDMRSFEMNYRFDKNFAQGNLMLANELGITLEELQARFDAGETVADLREEAGLNSRGAADGNSALAEGLGITVEELQQEINDFFASLYEEAGLEMPERGNGSGNMPGENNRDNPPRQGANGK